jgi:hypothetical protein
MFDRRVTAVRAFAFPWRIVVDCRIQAGKGDCDGGLL